MAHLQFADAIAAIEQGTDEVDCVKRRSIQGLVDEDDLAFFEVEHDYLSSEFSTCSGTLNICESKVPEPVEGSF